MASDIILSMRDIVKEQYRKQFYDSINPYELEEMDSGDIDEIFEEVWADVAPEVYEYLQI